MVFLIGLAFAVVLWIALDTLTKKTHPEVTSRHRRADVRDRDVTEPSAAAHQTGASPPHGGDRLGGADAEAMGQGTGDPRPGPPGPPAG